MEKENVCELLKQGYHLYVVVIKVEKYRWINCK